MASFLLMVYVSDEGDVIVKFSSLSESGFIPTVMKALKDSLKDRTGSHLFQRVASFLHIVSTLVLNAAQGRVLISFREWLHSYVLIMLEGGDENLCSSHLFQRVASFLPTARGAINTAPFL